MFNEDVKREFINYITSTTSGKAFEWENQFNRLEKIEVKLKKDFSEFSYKEMMKLLPFILVKTVAYQKQQLSILRQYLAWCISKGHTDMEENLLIGISSKDIDFSESYKMNMVKDEKQLQGYLDRILTDVKDDSLDNMNRIMFHLIFNGVEFNNVFDLEVNQVDFKNKALKYNDKLITLSDMCLDLINLGINMTHIIYSNGKQKKINKNGFILENSSISRKSMKKTAMSYSSEKFTELSDGLGFFTSVTLGSLWRSGVFYRTYQNEIITGQIDLSPIGDTNAILLEYNTWKKAFDLK